MNWNAIPPRYRRIGIAIVAFGLIVVLTPPIAHTIVESQIETRLKRLSEQWGYPIAFRRIEFTSLTQLTVEGLTLHGVPDSSHSLSWPANFPATVRSQSDSLWNSCQTEPLLHVGRAEIDFYALGFVTGRLLRRMSVDTIRLHVNRNQKGRFNFQNILEWRRNRQTDTTAVERPEEETGNRLSEWIEAYLEAKPPVVRIANLSMAYHDFTSTVPPNKWARPHPPNVFVLDQARVELAENALQNAELKIKGHFQDNDQSHEVQVIGQLDNRRHELQIEGSSAAAFKIPFSKELTNADIYLKAFDIRLLSLQEDRSTDNLKARLNVSDMEVFSDAISDQKLKGINIGFDLDLDLSEDSIWIRESTRAYLNQINLETRGYVAGMDGKPRMDLSFRIPRIRMSDFFYSIPGALMKKLKGLRVDGEMGWQARLQLDMARPDSVKLDPDIELSKDFRVVSFGDSIQVKTLREPFAYTVQLEDETDTTFEVGPANPYWTPLDSAAPILVAAVLMCEDASFMKNNGFNVLQIERSLAENIRKKRFARGASTISMQFVKNIFLSREKTLARKFQEMLLTWLMTHEKMLDPLRRKEEHKKRLLEIYLNIIEWGPDVFGVGRAAEFYFRKSPRHLTISEAVFLAGIIPNPKKYERYFEKGIPRKKHLNYMSVIVRILNEKGYLTKEEMETNTPIRFTITGEAAQWIEGYSGAESEDEDYERPVGE